MLRIVTVRYSYLLTYRIDYEHAAGVVEVDPESYSQNRYSPNLHLSLSHHYSTSPNTVHLADHPRHTIK